MVTSRLKHCVFFAYGLGIAILSLKPHIDMGDIPYNDKVAHFITYALFTLLAWLIKQSHRHFLYLAIGIIIYGGFIEIAQHFTGRTLSFYDFVANSGGVVVCSLLLHLLNKHKKNNRSFID